VTPDPHGLAFRRSEAFEGGLSISAASIAAWIAEFARSGERLLEELGGAFPRLSAQGVSRA